MGGAKTTEAVNFDATVGFEDDAQAVEWNRRDLLTYAVGIGAGAEQLDYAYELEPGFRAFATYPVVLGLKGAQSDTTLFADMVSARASAPGFPALDPKTIVHGEQSIEIHAPLPIVSGSGWKLRKRISAVHDKPSGLILETEVRLVSPLGRTHATMVGSAFYRGGGQGTGFSRSLISKPTVPAVPSRSPDFVHAEATSPTQALLYRLSGDYNPLHIDPSIGANSGLGGVILHGLCSFGFAARALLKAVDPQDGIPVAATAADARSRAHLQYISTRFTAPVRPGDNLETRVWFLNNHPTHRELVFEQYIANTGKKSLGGGYARIQLLPADHAIPLARI